MTGDELRAARTKLGYKQSELAGVLGLKEKTISDLETGRMNISLSVQNHVLILLKLEKIKKLLELP